MTPSLKINKILKRLFNCIRILLESLGAILLIAIILSFTSYPYWAYYWLGVHNSGQAECPNVIVLLGGGGMPSPDGLIRAYYAAKTANEFSLAPIIIAMPHDTALHEESPELLLAMELKQRGIDSSRICFETEGNNTRSQALKIAEMVGKSSIDTIVLRIVTSPEHMYRSVATFRKAGFKSVGGMASFEEAVSEKLLIGKHNKEFKTERLNLRYNMWNYLKYEITVVREYFAIAYYKLRGWI
jgi:uncharacterized SAM-binding protein YcdF (DUF218 family)